MNEQHVAGAYYTLTQWIEQADTKKGFYPNQSIQISEYTKIHIVFACTLDCARAKQKRMKHVPSSSSNSI